MSCLVFFFFLQGGSEDKYWELNNFCLDHVHTLEESSKFAQALADQAFDVNKNNHDKKSKNNLEDNKKCLNIFLFAKFFYFQKNDG